MSEADPLVIPWTMLLVGTLALIFAGAELWDELKRRRKDD